MSSYSYRADATTPRKDTDLSWLKDHGVGSVGSSRVVSDDEVESFRRKRPESDEPRVPQPKSGYVILSPKAMKTPNLTYYSSSASNKSSLDVEQQGKHPFSRFANTQRSGQKAQVDRDANANLQIKENFDADINVQGCSDLILQQAAILRQIQQDNKRLGPDKSRESMMFKQGPVCQDSLNHWHGCTKTSPLQHQDTLTLKPTPSSSLKSHENEAYGSRSHRLEFNDPSIFDQQRRILRQIELERKEKEQSCRRIQGTSMHSSPGDQANPKPCQAPLVEKIQPTRELQSTSNYPRKIVDHINSYSSPPPTSFTSTRNSPLYNGMTFASKNIDKTPIKTFNSDGAGTSTTRYGRRKLIVRDKRKTLDSIALGDAILVQCLACRSVLQVPSHSKLLFCTICHDVSRIERRSDVDHDFIIATALQEEERQLIMRRQREKNSISKFDRFA